MGNKWGPMTCVVCGKTEVRSSNATHCTECSPSTTKGLKHQLEIKADEYSRLKAMKDEIEERDRQRIIEQSGLPEQLAAAERERDEYYQKFVDTRLAKGFDEKSIEILTVQRDTAQAECERLREALAECVEWLATGPDYLEGAQAVECLDRARAALATSTAGERWKAMERVCNVLEEYRPELSRKMGYSWFGEVLNTLDELAALEGE